MIKISTEKLPKLVINDLAYLLYYSIYGFLASFFLIVPLFKKFGKGFIVKNDYEYFFISIIFGVLVGILCKIIITPIERKIIKRNIFIAGIINILKKNEKLRFKEILDKYSYFLFQNSKVLSWNTQWESWLEALIAIDVIELKNEKEIKGKCEVFDYKYFGKNLDDCIFILKNKKIDVDDLVKRLDDYIL